MATCIKCKGALNFIIEGRSIRLQSDGDVTVLVSTQKRTEAYDGEFTMEDRNAKIIATVVVPVDLYVRYFQMLCNVPLVLELCDGRTFSTEHASNISDNPYDAKKNLQPLELITDEITELLPQAA
jgi:hypothetical protein